MTKFLLILILFNPSIGQYRDFVMAMDTQAECEKSLKEVRMSIKEQRGIIFSLSCQKAIPTGATET